jgi:hypothetical protein
MFSIGTFCIDTDAIAGLRRLRATMVALDSLKIKNLFLLLEIGPGPGSGPDNSTVVTPGPGSVQTFSFFLNPCLGPESVFFKPGFRIIFPL